MVRYKIEKLLYSVAAYTFFMYILYLDESGEPSDWRGQKNFVMAGIAVHETQIYSLGKKLAAVQAKHFPEINVPIAFHAEEIHNRKRIFRNMQPEAREALLCDLYKTIADNRFPLVSIFGAVITIDAVTSASQARSDTFEECISGFNSFLVVQHRLGKSNKGLVIIDKNREEQYKQLLDSFKQNGTRYGYLANITDIPYFARCLDTPMLQLADLCSYALFRQYEKNDNAYFNPIVKLFFKNGDGRMFGLKHITKNKSCDCVTCVTQKTFGKTYNEEAVKTLYDDED